MLQIYGQSRPEGEGYSEPDIKIPGALGNTVILFIIKFYICVLTYSIISDYKLNQLVSDYYASQSLVTGFFSRMF